MDWASFPTTTSSSRLQHRYALSALRNKRASLASEIVQLKRQLRHCRESLGHVDATLRLLDPSVDIDAIPNKRIRKRIKLFRQGELGRMILGVLREANGAVSTAALVSGVLDAAVTGSQPGARWHHGCARTLLIWRGEGTVLKSGSGKRARWQVV